MQNRYDLHSPCGKLHALNDLVVTPPAHQVRRYIPFVAVGLLSLFCLPANGFGQPSPLPVTRIDDRPVVEDLDAPHAVSLTIAQPLPLKDALMLLVRGTAFSIVLDDAAEGTFSGELKGLTLRQSIDAVLRPHALEYTLDGNLIAIHRRRLSMRLFDVSFLNVRRESQRGIRSGSPGDPASAQFSTSVGDSYYDEIDRGVVSLLSPEGRAHVDRRHGVVQVTDFRDHLDRLSTYLETVHVRALRQVRLSARIVEVTLADPTAEAIDWNAVAARSGQPWGAPGGNAGIRVPDFSAVVAALAAQGSVRTIASPQLLAMNSEPAVIRLGSPEGFTMTITPYIDAGGMVHLSVSPTYSEKTAAATVSVAEADTVLRIRDGDSIALAGLLQRKDTARVEYVILLNATVVTPGPVASMGAR